MGRTERLEIPWAGGNAVVEMRVWSARERDMHARKFGLAGEFLTSGVIGALSDPKVNAAKSIQMVRTLLDDQRKRADEQGDEASFDKLATVVTGLALPLSPDGFDGNAPREQKLDVLHGLDADLFDAVLKAVDSALYLKPEEKKSSDRPGSGGP